MSNSTIFLVVLFELIGVALLLPWGSPLDDEYLRGRVWSNVFSIMALIYTSETYYNAYHTVGAYFAGANLIIFIGFICWQQKRISNANKKATASNQKANSP